MYPRNWKKCNFKFHGYLDANKRYPVLYVSDVNNYGQREALNEEYVWLIDYEHQINEETLPIFRSLKLGYLILLNIKKLTNNINTTRRNLILLKISG